MSDSTEGGRERYRVRQAHERLDEHEQVHDQFDRRISMNENWRLQAQGALKVIAIILGTGALAWISQTLVTFF